MPRRDDLRSIFVIGSGPIVIGQAAEFDYSGTQACRALKALGYRVILVNSNPATIMTDPETADAIYVEPVTLEIAELILERERPDALLPTLGGQTGLNLAVELAEAGLLKKFNVELLGARLETIRKAEDRELFHDAMRKIGLEVPRGGFARSLDEAIAKVEEIGYPAIVRPSFTLGGSGSGAGYNLREFEKIAARGLALSPIHEILVEQSVIGWKEYELEVMRDRADNAVIVCSIENLDPMGVHTGDSITVAPAQTLSDREYQAMRDDAIKAIREIGVECGGSNVQFAVDPASGRRLIIEINPRVSRSSALASKATGFPIAKIAAKLAVGFTLPEIPNDITLKTPACFEPAIDYVVVKLPRFNFEKFPGAADQLGTQMRSVGEAMAIGRTFREALQKGLRSLETGLTGFDAGAVLVHDAASLAERLRTPNSRRLLYLREALRRGWKIDELYALTAIDPWFLRHLEALAAAEAGMAERELASFDAAELRRLKADGFSDAQIARALKLAPEGGEEQVRQRRRELGVAVSFKSVDTCAGEFEASTPYFYSSYEPEPEGRPIGGRAVVILGSGPNRIGQGVEFDYCCVQASLAVREEGLESILINCNPETVSTDYDVSSRLYFEPLTLEDVLAIVEAEQPLGVIVQFGGQTPLKLAGPLKECGVPILGTSPDAIDLAEDRRRFGTVLDRLGLRAPPYATVLTAAEATREADRIGYPVLVRPSYVLGGRSMEVVFDRENLERAVEHAFVESHGRPVLIDRFLEDAFEVDIDALCDGERAVIGGILQHIEEAGVHSGDSSCVLPPYKIGAADQDRMREMTRTLALELGVRGLINVQFALKDGLIYILEANPRASRTVPFISKATGVPLARLATKVVLGRTLAELGFTAEPRVGHIAIKESVFPFQRFEGVDVLLGPEMKSTGEVMGISHDFGISFAKAQAAAGQPLPAAGTVFLSVNDRDKPTILPIARRLAELGLSLTATRGTCRYLEDRGLVCASIYKVNEGRPNTVDAIISGHIQMLINTPLGKVSYFDDKAMRRAALERGVPYITTTSGAAAAAEGIASLQQHRLEVRHLKEYY
ncbi:MAG TPA: carbamoyl-phosphate synthase large subunit [Acidobacteriota bacterium]